MAELCTYTHAHTHTCFLFDVTCTQTYVCVPMGITINDIQVQITVQGNYSQTSIFARGSRNELQYVLMANTTYSVTVSQSESRSVPYTGLNYQHSFCSLLFIVVVISCCS